MALKFLNKKGWHTGSLRNIENVWKAEQKHEAEQKKLEELRKQIQDEREQSEFRQLQEQAGLVPKQERLEFLYDSGLAVGKGSSDSFAMGKPGEPQKIESENELSKLAAVPGALFVVEKPASANDTWRKLHSDPLLMIRQREQEALSQIRNNPVKMEMIKKSLDVKKLRKEEKERKKAEKKNRKKEKHKREPSSESESDMDTPNKLRKTEKKKRKKEKEKRETSSNSDSDMDAATRLKKTQHKQLIGSELENKMVKGISNEEDMKIKRNRLMEPLERYNSNTKIPEDRERLKNSEKQDERRCHQEKPRSPSNYRQLGAQSPSENGGRIRSRSPNHGKILSHRSRYRSRSPSEYGERHRSRSPLDRVKSQHYTQKHESQSLSDYGRRHRSPLQNGGRHRSPSGYVRRQRSPLPDSGRHRSPSGYVRRQRSPLQDSGRHRSPSDSGRRCRSPLQDSGRHRPPLQDSVRYGAHSPDGVRNKLPSDHRNKIVSQQGRVNDIHVRGTDSQSAEEKPSTVPDHAKPASRPKYQTGKLSEEEKAARLREMQMDAELHDEQRWQRLKKASEADAREALEAARVSGKNFLDVTNKRVYGADKGGSSTIEESVRRRTHYLQGSASATEGNAFRR